MKTIFTTGQVAKICKVAPRTVSKWFDSGRLRGYRIPGSQDRRIPREHLIRFLKEHGMPLGELEDEAVGKILIVGAEAVIRGGLKEQMNPDIQARLREQWIRGRHPSRVAAPRLRGDRLCDGAERSAHDRPEPPQERRVC